MTRCCNPSRKFVIYRARVRPATADRSPASLVYGGGEVDDEIAGNRSTRLSSNQISGTSGPDLHLIPHALDQPASTRNSGHSVQNSTMPHILVFHSEELNRDTSSRLAYRTIMKLNANGKTCAMPASRLGTRLSSIVARRKTVF